MLAVEQWLFDTVAKQYQVWKNESVCSFRLCMKLFPRQFASEHVVGEFIRLIERIGISPTDLVVDLPGPSLDGDLDRGCVILDTLQRKGIQVALDNVGTKSWSIDAMRRLPWEILKIDPSLVQASPPVLADSVIIRMLIGLGSDLSRRVVAEGVANLAQLEHLLSIGCSEAMGDYICPPLSDQDMTAWLKERNSLTVPLVA